MQTESHYQQLYNSHLLYGFKRKDLLVLVKDGERQYYGIELHVNPILIQEHVHYLKNLLAGMGYSISGNTNTQSITIR